MRISFKGITCVVPRTDCARCPISSNCLYNLYFNRTVRGISVKAFNLHVDFETDREGHIKKIDINLKVWGNAAKHRKFFIFAIMRMAKLGLGKERIKFSIDYIYDRTKDAVLYGDYLRLAFHMAGHISKNGNNSQKIRLRLISPIRLDTDNFIKVNIGPAEIIQAIQERFRLLQNEYGICSLENMPIFRLPPLEMEQKTLKWVSWNRYSYIQGKKLSMGGFVGHMTFRPANEQVIIWLSIGEIIGVGLGTSFGLGRIEYENL